MPLPKEYKISFNAITDAIHDLENTVQMLKQAQIKAEEEFISKEPSVVFGTDKPVSTNDD